jgi:hypothetical protein
LEGLSIGLEGLTIALERLTMSVIGYFVTLYSTSLDAVAGNVTIISILDIGVASILKTGGSHANYNYRFLSDDDGRVNGALE